jgi:hypothetical protein
MRTRVEPTKWQAVVTCASAVLTALLCAGLMIAAALNRPPTALLPIIVGACVSFPMLAAWEAAPSIAILHGRRRTHRRVMSQLRRELDALPETRHPLGL